MLIISVQALGTFDYFNIAVSLLDFIRTAGKISCSYAIPFCSNKICACVLISDLFSSLFIPSNGLLIWELGSGRWAWKLRALKSSGSFIRTKKIFSSPPHFVVVWCCSPFIQCTNTRIEQNSAFFTFGFCVNDNEEDFLTPTPPHKRSSRLESRCGKNK